MKTDARNRYQLESRLNVSLRDSKGLFKYQEVRGRVRGWMEGEGLFMYVEVRALCSGLS